MSGGIKPPTKIDTPYGGQLIWQLPKHNTLTVHLKDKSKICHKKRWSQVGGKYEHQIKPTYVGSHVSKPLKIPYSAKL